MKSQVREHARDAFIFAGYRHIDLRKDIYEDRRRLPQLQSADALGRWAVRIRDGGSDYSFTQIDYINQSNYEEILARRMIAVIQPGDRTELAYWKPAAPEKKLSIHWGAGQLISARVDDERVSSHELDSRSRSHASLAPGSFYSFISSQLTENPFVVSGLYEAPFQSWENLEIAFSPEDSTVISDDKLVTVPNTFSQIFER